MNEVNVGSDHRKVRCRVKIDTRRERRHLFHHTPEHLRVPPFYVEEFTIKLQNRNAALEEEDGNINETTRQQSQQHHQISGSDSQRVRNSSQNGQEVLQRNPRSDGETKESPTTNFSSRKSWSSRTEKNRKNETTLRFQKALNGINSRSNQARKRFQNGKEKNSAAESFNLQEFKRRKARWQ